MRFRLEDDAGGGLRFLLPAMETIRAGFIAMGAQSQYHDERQRGSQEVTMTDRRFAKAFGRDPRCFILDWCGGTFELLCAHEQ
jgi:hypothetical protein